MVTIKGDANIMTASPFVLIIKFWGICKPSGVLIKSKTITPEKLGDRRFCDCVKTSTECAFGIQPMHMCQILTRG